MKEFGKSGPQYKELSTECFKEARGNFNIQF